jgi:hypothetical protein
MLFDRVLALAFAPLFLLACGDSNLGTPQNFGAGDASTSGSSGTNNALASGQCPPVGSMICPNDPAATQSDVDDCNKSLSDATCGSDYKLYLECAGNNVKCDSSGQSDSSSIQSACANQAQIYKSCAGGDTVTTDGG